MLAQSFHWLADNLDRQTMSIASPPPIKKTPKTLTPHTEAGDAIKNFCVAHGKGVRKNRLATLSEKINPYADECEKYMPTAWAKKPLVIPKMTLLDMTDAKTAKECKKLCRASNLFEPCAFIMENAHHYGYYENGELTFYMVLSIACMNNIPISIMVSVDILASKTKTHMPTRAIESINKILRKRRLTCILFAQVVTKKETRKWWKGKLTENSKSAIPTVLLHEFDARYPIYERCTDFALFYD